MKKLRSDLSVADVHNVHHGRMVRRRADLGGQKQGIDRKHAGDQKREGVRKLASALVVLLSVLNVQDGQSVQADVRDAPRRMIGSSVRHGLGAALRPGRERTQPMMVTRHHLHRASRSRRTSGAAVHAAPSLKAAHLGHAMPRRI